MCHQNAIGSKPEFGLSEWHLLIDAGSHCLGQHMKNWFGQLRVCNKLYLGFAIVTGVAALGATAGVLLGDAVQHYALQLEDDVKAEIDLIGQLERSLLMASFHERALIDTLDRPERFADHYQGFQIRLLEANAAWEKLREGYGEPGIKETQAELLAYQALLADDGALLLSNYGISVRAIVHNLALESLSPYERATVRASLLSLSRDRTHQKLQVILDRLANLAEAISYKETVARQVLEESKHLRHAIIIVSTSVSGGVAIVLAIIISRAISRPLQASTQVARAIVREEDFSLTVPIANNDEIGELSQVLNGLLDTVRTLLAEGEARNADLSAALAELQAAQDEIVQSEKMAALGQLVAGIGHEINTPLGAIGSASSNLAKASQAIFAYLPRLATDLTPAERQLLFALLQTIDRHTELPLLTTREKRPRRRALQQFLEERGIEDARNAADILVELGFQPETAAPFIILFQGSNASWLLQFAYDCARLRQNNRTIEVSVRRAATVVSALKRYSRHDPDAERQHFDPIDGIKTVLEIYRYQFRQDIELVCDFPRSDLLLWGYPDELSQVWMNLIQNALQAMAGGPGTLEIAVGDRGDGGLTVTVTDSGVGIPAAARERIFDPFFTTKPSGLGSGLGLDICHRIVTKHGGSIQASSHPGRTVFAVWLPWETSNQSANPSRKTLPAIA